MRTSPQVSAQVPNDIAWKALKNVIQRFHFDKEEAMRLMGNMPSSSYYKGINKLEGNLSRDEKERISLLLGIYKNLRLLFMDSNQAMSWINRENTLPPFNGVSPRQYMMEGGLVRLFEVRRFLDYWRGY